jgi:hypothetical protein
MKSLLISLLSLASFTVALPFREEASLEDMNAAFDEEVQLAKRGEDPMEGYSVTCVPGTADIPGGVFRISHGKLRHYPHPEIAASWDMGWEYATLTDCRRFPKGPSMEMYRDGIALTCMPNTNSISGAVFRLSRGAIRHYPNPDIANSWDPKWPNAVSVNCLYYYHGPAMGPITEGISVICIPGTHKKPDGAVYRVTGGIIRHYPNPPIADSWDKSWMYPELIDCSRFREGEPMPQGPLPNF